MTDSTKIHRLYPIIRTITHAPGDCYQPPMQGEVSTSRKPITASVALVGLLAFLALCGGFIAMYIYAQAYPIQHEKFITGSVW